MRHKTLLTRSTGIERLSDASQQPLRRRILGSPPQGVFPDAQHTPIGPPQGARHQPVPRLIGRELLSPERGVALGLGRVLRSAVPETAVHEHHQPQFGKDEVRSHP